MSKKIPQLPFEHHESEQVKHRESEQSSSEAPKTFPGLTRVLPLAEEGFFTQLRSQSFFGPALFTVVVGLLLFVFFQLMLSTKQVIYAYGYQFILGLYLGTMILLAISRIAQVSISFGLMLGVATFTGLLLAWRWPVYLLSFVFSPAPLRSLAESRAFLPALVGHFTSSGLLEELLKSLPLWLFFVWADVLGRSDILDKQGRLHPLVAVVIGSASAMGFIVIETSMDYVPRLQQQTDMSMGMMLLIPRLLTGICGHLAWTGIFAYFIGLSQFYKRRGAIALVFLGWGIAAFLHALWNACIQAELPLTGALIALFSFVMFIGYLYKAKVFFASPVARKTFSIPLSAMPRMQETVRQREISAPPRETSPSAALPVRSREQKKRRRSISPFQTLILGSLPSRLDFSSEELPAAQESSPTLVQSSSSSVPQSSSSPSGSEYGGTVPFVEAAPDRQTEKDLPSFQQPPTKTTPSHRFPDPKRD